jgi:hypothetical protein
VASGKREQTSDMQKNRMPIGFVYSRGGEQISAKTVGLNPKTDALSS